MSAFSHLLLLDLGYSDLLLLQMNLLLDCVQLLQLHLLLLVHLRQAVDVDSFNVLLVVVEMLIVVVGHAGIDVQEACWPFLYPLDFL